ncbi:MAG: S8 family serine peptidase [Myxococcota bacterium]
MRRTLALAAISAASLLSRTDARAEWPPPLDVEDLSDPQYWPNDPGYGGQWNLWSFVGEAAQGTVRSEELAMGSGFHADRAWQRTTGDSRVVIAVLDSGIKWHDGDLVTKYFLNAAELPRPHANCRGEAWSADDPDDSNGDGIFSMRDWALPSEDGLPRTSCDPLVSDQNGNTLIDPQDLIAAFEDGVDDDANGYVDDISGWDFFDGDNDANDDTDFGHGTGEANDSAAAANDGRGDAGVCPDCRLLMVRVADSFVCEVNDWAMGALFAVDSGVSVIQEALGSIDNSTLSRDAIEYAYANDVVIIASAADEDSFHANFPGTNNHTVYVHAITYDAGSWQDARSYLRFNNCTNYGAQLVLSTPGTGCSSEATGKTSGIAGLIYAAALAADLPFPDGAAKETDLLGARRISAEEVKQLLLTTVDDIDVAGSESDPAVYPSRPGWEQRFGYGRPNARTAVDRVFQGAIPPEVDIDDPIWFQVLYPDVTPSVPIVAHLSFRADRYDALDWTLEWAPGIEPDDDPDGGDWTIIAQGSIDAPLAGTLAEWDISQLEIDNPPMPAPDLGVNRHLVTVRLRAVARTPPGGGADVPGVMRKAFHVVRDPDLLPGFPLYVGASGEAAVKMADIDGDGVKEIILADADGQVHAIRGGGGELPGWPALINVYPGAFAHAGARAFATKAADPDTRSAMMASPAIDDLDGDGEIEVVASSYDGYLFVFEPDGSVRSGFPVEVDRALSEVTDGDHILDDGFFSSPVLADLDGDGALEILAGAMDGWLYAWRADGETQTGFPVLLRKPGGELVARSVSAPAVGDVDGDGALEIALGSNEDYGNYQGLLYLVHADGNAHPGGPYVEGWPRRFVSLSVLPLIGEGLPNAPSMADVDGDGDDEIAIAGLAGPVSLLVDPAGDPDDVQPFNMAVFGTGASSQDKPAVALITNGAFGDLDLDGVVEYVQPTGGFKAANAFAGSGVRTDFDHHVSAWRLDADIQQWRMLDDWPRRNDEWQFFMAPVIADIDGDGFPEVLAGSAGYFLHAWNALGEEPEGWPKLTGQMVTSPAAVGDIDGDDELEVAVPTRTGFLYAWNARAIAASACVEWASFRHDNRNSGNYGTPLGAPRCTSDALGEGESESESEPPAGGDDGCGCALGGRDAREGAPIAALLLLLAAIVRRRRAR